MRITPVQDCLFSVQTGLVDVLADAVGDKTRLVYITHHYEEVLPCVTHVLHLRGGAIAFAGDGIRVNAIAPGWIESPMTQSLRDDPNRNQAIIDRTPLKRWGDPSELVGPALFLASALLPLSPELFSTSTADMPRCDLY